jgi:uncharacterized protein YecT (DUF1311 family)
MADQNRRIAIIVAVIGLAGTVAASVLSNWDKIFGAPVSTMSAPVADATGSSSSPPQTGMPPRDPSIIEPSFSCAKASTNAEHLVCSSPELAVLDLSIANAYRDALAATNRPYERKQLKAAQLFWLREIRGRCGDAACLRDVYEKRLEELRGASR